MEDEIANDSRFSHILKDPKFRKLPKKHVKVKIDKRFQSMFNDKKFQIKYKVDKRGRPVKIGGSEDLKQYYEISESENEEEKRIDFDEVEEKELCKEKLNRNTDANNERQKIIKNKKLIDFEHENEAETQENSLLIKGKENLPSAVKKKLKDLTVDYARGEGAIFSDSSSDEDSSDSENSNQIELVHEWGELDKDAEHTDKSTNRLAVCNMDWDRIEAKDLMVLFNSFLTPGSLIHSIDIYPSEFGLQRMKEEEEKGPIELQENIPEEEEVELSQIQMEKLRKYQLNRLRYYYAVVTCDSPETADALYKECDGLEYESSSSKLDLRFIPDDMTFDQEPKESCTSLPDFSTYKPRLFTTSALTKAKVDLTWDEGDPNREEVVKSIHRGNIDESNLRKYLACSSSEESDDDNNQNGVEEKSKEQSDIEKYKALLLDIENNEKKKTNNEVNMEVSWNLDLEKKTDSIVKEVVKEKSKKTPFQQYLEKKKEKKKKKQMERKSLLAQELEKSDESAFSDDEIPSDIDLNDPYFKEEIDARKSKKPSKKKKQLDKVEDEKSTQDKAELELLMLDNEEDNRHFSVKKIEEFEKQKKKKLTKGQKRRLEDLKDFKDEFKIDVNDERFSALYTSHHFNIDPADPQFKSTKATRQLIEEKLRRREREENGVAPSPKKPHNEENIKTTGKNTELSVLVKTIKKNTEMIKKKPRHG